MTPVETDDLHRIHETLFVSIRGGRPGLVALVEQIDERTTRTDKRIDGIFRFLIAVFTPVLVAFLLAMIALVGERVTSG